MLVQKTASLFDRRQFLTGAGVLSLGSNIGKTRAQSRPTNPIRIQIPDLAFASALEKLLAQWHIEHSATDLTLAVVPAEPASTSLLNDIRSKTNQFSGALVPVWTIPDLVRDDFVIEIASPVAPLPPAIAALRSFEGRWIASDFDHDCDLLYYRTDLLEQNGFFPARTWEELEQHASFLFERIGGGIALPQTHSQQAVDHFVSMAAAFAFSESNAKHFWFDPETMIPAIDSNAFMNALESWRILANATPETLRSVSSGGLWNALLDGSVGYLIASTDFLPYALEQGADMTTIGISALPGILGDSGAVERVGNTTGASWGGVIMRSASEPAQREIAAFFAELAKPDIQTGLALDPATSITPLPTGAQQIDRFLAAGWPERPVSAWLDAIASTLTNPVQLPQLRIAETRRYLRALETHLVTYLSGNDDSAEKTLASAAADWNEITAAIGLDTQRELLRQSSMLPPATD